MDQLAQNPATASGPAEAGREERRFDQGHWIEAIHTAHLACDFFNGAFREHVLVDHLERTNPDLLAKIDAASLALYDVYNTVSLLSCDDGDEIELPQ